MKLRIKKGDTVVLRVGKDAGKRGKVIAVMPGDAHIIIEGVNMFKRHTRARQAGKKGSIVEYPASLHVSKVLFVCPECSKPTRVGFVRKDGTRMRVCKKCKREFI